MDIKQDIRKLTSLSPAWYAVHTTPRAEKKIKERLDQIEVENYLPLKTEIRLWSDRKKKVVSPLIPGYIFVYVSSDRFRSVLETFGVLSFLKEKSIPAAIPAKQIENLRIMIEYAPELVEFTAEKFNIGDKVKIKQGELRGLCGELIEVRGKYKIVVRLDHFGCSLLTVPLSMVEQLEPLS